MIDQNRIKPSQIKSSHLKFTLVFKSRCIRHLYFMLCLQQQFGLYLNLPFNFVTNFLGDDSYFEFKLRYMNVTLSYTV